MPRFFYLMRRLIKPQFDIDRKGGKFEKPCFYIQYVMPIISVIGSPVIEKEIISGKEKLFMMKAKRI